MSTTFGALHTKNDAEMKVNGHIPKKPSSMRPLSVFSKTFLSILCIHVLVLVALGLFVQQPAVLVIAGIESLIAGLTLFGLRWPPLLGSLLGTMMLYIFTSQTSFPIHHLTHPKDAFGYGVLPAISFVMYTVMTGLFWCGAMLILTGVVSVFHNYFLHKRQVFSWYRAVMVGAICLWVGAVLVGALVQPDPPLTALGPTTVALQAGSFSQPSITLTKGDKLTLVDSGSYHHNLSMGRWVDGQPVLGSQPGAPSLRNQDVTTAGTTVVVGPFNVAGTFYLICSLHHNMMLKIIVK